MMYQHKKLNGTGISHHRVSASLRWTPALKPLYRSDAPAQERGGGLIGVCGVCAHCVGWRNRREQLVRYF